MSNPIGDEVCMFVLVLLMGFVCIGLDHFLFGSNVLTKAIESLLIFQALRRSSRIDQL